MTINITWQTLIAAAAVVAALGAIGTNLAKGIRWMDRQKAQDKEIRDIKEEQSLITYGLLACLKGLKEQGCDGPVTEAVDKIEKHLNVKAHGG
jgi:hypothetical protein